MFSPCSNCPQLETCFLFSPFSCLTYPFLPHPASFIFLFLLILFCFSLLFSGLNYEYEAVNLLKGEQFSPGNFYFSTFPQFLSQDRIFFFSNKPSSALKLRNLKLISIFTLFSRPLEYEKLNPIGYVPTLVDGDVVVADSFAIIMVCAFCFQFIYIISSRFSVVYF